MDGVREWNACEWIGSLVVGVWINCGLLRTVEIRMGVARLCVPCQRKMNGQVMLDSIGKKRGPQKVKN